MTQEEKAKAYDEVRKKIAIRFGSNVADEIFSQFEESEDERIRKSLLVQYKGFKSTDYYDDGIMFGDVVNWFEKQGDKDEEILILKDQIESLHAAIKAIKETHKIELEKQGEQKPTDKTKIYDSMDDLIADALIEEIESSELDDRGKYNRIHWIKSHRQKSVWSEEDEYNQAWIIEMLYGLEDEDKEYEKKCRDMAEWFKSLNNKCFPLKPKMWSEEDEKIALSIEQVMNCASLLNIAPENIDKIRTWLKSLKDRVQPKQEWGALDEINLQGVIDEIQANKNNAPDYDLETYDRFLNWLKSLRPQKQWKPSEEQIRAFEWAYKSSKIEEGSKYDIDCKDLLEQLKAL